MSPLPPPGGSRRSGGRRSGASGGHGDAPPHWTPAEAQDFLRSMDLFGMRFGLDRMRRMTTVLGLPQGRFDCVHVVGTNGKSSTTRFIAAILQRHGLRTGAYLSPHLVSYTERIQVAEADLPPERFAAAVAQAAWAAERVNRTLGEGDAVTQFELLTAAAFWALAEQDVAVAVVEAGLGGRYDATNVMDSSVAVLTNVGLEHTRWLGPTIRDIAAEKLAVVRPGTTLVLGSAVDAEVQALAEILSHEHDTRLLRAPAASEDLTAPTHLLAGGRFQRENFALARTAAQAYLRGLGRELDPQAVIDAAAATAVPGRFELLPGDPPTVLDGAHNPASISAMAASLPDFAAGRPLATVLAVLDDKDAAGMLRALAPHTERLWVTAAHTPRALPPPTLQSLAHQVGYEEVLCEGDPHAALAAAREWAAAVPGGGVVLVTGSIYLIGDLSREVDAPEGAQP